MNHLIAHFRDADCGKEPQPLWQHLYNVSQISGSTAEKIGIEKAGEVIGLLHDLGKASKEFQNYIKSAEGFIDPDNDEFIDTKAKKGKVDHSSAGAQIAFQILSTKGPKEKLVGQFLSICIASHHSGLINCLDPNGNNRFKDRMNKPEENTHTIESFSCLSKVEQKIIIDKLNNEYITTQLINKLNNLQEKNDSQDTLVFKYGLLIRFLFSCLIDADRLDTANFEMPNSIKMRNYGQYHSWDVLVQRLDKKIREFEQKQNINIVDITRTEISQACFDFSNKPKGIYQLTVPTGGGKTLASLRFALNHAAHHNMDRIFFVIPYTSIIDQNAEEIRRILEEKDKNGNYLDQVILEHHSNLTPEKESKKQSLLAENWDAPIVFTTQVQFLETLFGSGTRNARRMHQLANSIIIFDEIQTIPVRCVHIFNIALRFLIHGCGSTAVLCTATQPLLDQVDPRSRSLDIEPNQQIIKNENELYKRLKRVIVYDRRKIGGWNEEETADLAIREMQEMGSTLVVVNTRKSARLLFQKIFDKGISNIFHLSTNMCAAHRLNVLNRIKGFLDCDQPIICVSTQLIEAGVDIDFGSVIRYLAGMDSITQAAGRCNRNGKREFGNVWIINPENENLERLWDIRIGADNAIRVLDEYKNNPKAFDEDPLGLKIMRRFYEYYFYSRKDEMKYNFGKKSIVGRNDDLFNLLALNRVSTEEYERINHSAPDTLLRQSFHTATEAFRTIDSAGQGVIVPYGDEGNRIITDLCGSFESRYQYQLLRKAQRYSVNLFPNEFKQMAKNNAIVETRKDSGIFYLDEQYYSELFGWSTETENQMNLYIF
ncbi:CRISPR-associated helicase Cas3' [Pelolinea submarina]|uniref:CRISPR-associated Cas3 family helicase n=1 Tax=Pelolinea submarina TaxID=913107 RepID=A0A347ZUR0_9CHLR|nr:CRISPR-associated helicase Cas3' [Pelolinea submarina]REG10373.1 CRISPR-associated Cas3 family helicase [Pelolinea submarina]BBB49041.1 CRISPR-associated endonuclease/helicase Cas3 [Pelolinea submarina]